MSIFVVVCCHVNIVDVCYNLDTNTVTNKKSTNNDVHDHLKDITKAITMTKINMVYYIMSYLKNSLSCTPMFPLIHHHKRKLSKQPIKVITHADRYCDCHNCYEITLDKKKPSLQILYIRV